MKRFKNIIILAIVGLIIWAYQKVRAFKSMDLAAGWPTNFRFQGVGTLEFTLPITVFNASGTSVNIGGIDLRVYVEGIYIGRAYMSERLRIAGIGTTIIPATVRISTYDLATGIPGFIAGAQDRNVTFTYQGYATVEMLFAPISFSHNFNLPKI